MRIGRQTAAVRQFLAEILQLLLLKAALQKSAGVISRRGVPLKINQIRWTIAVATLKKMVVGHLVKRGAGGETGDVAANAVKTAVGIHHHGHGIPTNET